MLDWRKQRTFAKLGEHLASVFGEKYGVKFNFYQGPNANHFSVYTDSKTVPCMRLEFTNENRLIVEISDGIHVPSFGAACSMQEAVVRYEDGFWFDFSTVSSAAARLLDTGRELFEENEKRVKAERKFINGSVKDLIGDFGIES